MKWIADDTRFFFVTTQAQIYRICVMLPLSFLLMWGEAQYPVFTHFRDTTHWVLSPLVWVQQQLHRGWYIVVGMVNQQHQFDTLNTTYQQTLLLLAKQRRMLEHVQTENTQLRALLQMHQAQGWTTQGAEIIRSEVQQDAYYLLLNKGYYDGVKIDEVVVAENGIVGQVSSVGPHHSQVITLFSSAHAIPVKIGSKGELYIAQGDIYNRYLTVEDVLLETSITATDAVLSSGLGGRFPPGMAVGIVRDIARIPNRSFQRVTIVPAVDITRLRYVLIMRQKENRD